MGTVRENKGKNLRTIPDEYIVIDIETTGLSPEWDDIIEVAAIKYSHEKAIDSYSSLIRPDAGSDYYYVSDFIEDFTGITSEMLASAPAASIVLPKFRAFLGHSILVGHNVNFDINFLYDAFQDMRLPVLSNDYVDTMLISRLLHPEEKHHRLSDLCERYFLNNTGAHRAGVDCEITNACLHVLKDDIIQHYGSVQSFTDYAKARRALKAENIHSEHSEFDKSHPLYGKVCVFTGTLEKMIRREAMQIVADLGGINADNVTKKTNYLILGNNDYCLSIKDGKSSKQKKAEKLKLAGQDIEIIPEDVFYDMIDSE